MSESSRRRRVFHTASLTATAAVLAMSLQSGALAATPDSPSASYGDASILDPDLPDADE